jgi:anti-sigma B factor antagonist
VSEEEDDVTNEDVEPARAELSIEARAMGDRTVLTVRGELDLYTAPALRDRVLAAAAEGQRRLVIDLSGVPFMDSSGLGVIVACLKRLRESGGELAVVAAARDLGVSEEITEDLRLAASELVANAVEAAGSGPIRLALRGDPGTVRLEVSGIGDVVDASPISRRSLLESLFDATDLSEEGRVVISVPTEAGPKA